MTYLTVEAVAERLQCSPRTVQSLIARDALPYRRVPGMRRLLIVERELDAYIDGAELEIVALPRGGRVVRVVTQDGF